MTKMRLLKRLKADEIPLEPCSDPRCSSKVHAKREIEGCHNCQKDRTQTDLIEFTLSNEPHISCSRLCVHDFVSMRLDDLLGQGKDTNSE